ncbi:MAG: C39 family peptidase [Anaerolineales bacterium]|nr:C39 family peptidase [Anaerolineales bacterium]
MPFSAGSPLTPASAEYVVDFGDAQQIGQIRMTVPLEGSAKEAAPEGSFVYMVWAEPTAGFPSVVGARVVEEGIHFPVVGAGKYQVFKLLDHEALLQMVSLYDPLAVPTYQQRTPAWCSPTAMTNVVNYHQGSWPVGGFGAVWGESSNWYLAGKAGQPFNKGYFFNWLLGAGGYSVPADVKQSFSDGNVEVIIWNWSAAVWYDFSFSEGIQKHVDYGFADNLFDSFQAYVESFVWGVNGSRRPVAWGSSLAGHSRTITGSNGNEYYFNDPSSVSLNTAKTWAAYRQEVMDSITAPKIEVIDTVVFYAEPRPANARRGVLWLFPQKDDGFPGSVALIDGATEQPATNWDWDGDLGHENGYFHEDLRGVLPTDPVFDSQFKALDLGDEVEYVFGIKNMTDAAYDFHVDVTLQNENLSVLENVGTFDATVNPGGRVDFNPADRFDLFGLPPGLYTLKFVLLQNGVTQDVKYVQFRVAQTELLFIVPEAVLIKNAFCRKGPDPVFDDLTAFEAGTELTLLGYNPDRTWGYFEREINDIALKCWIALGSVEIKGGGDAPILSVPAMPTATAAPVCRGDMDQPTCEAAGGTYFVGMAGVSCRCPE